MMPERFVRLLICVCPVSPRLSFHPYYPSHKKQSIPTTNAAFFFPNSHILIIAAKLVIDLNTQESTWVHANRLVEFHYWDIFQKC